MLMPFHPGRQLDGPHHPSDPPRAVIGTPNECQGVCLGTLRAWRGDPKAILISVGPNTMKTLVPSIALCPHWMVHTAERLPATASRCAPTAAEGDRESTGGHATWSSGTSIPGDLKPWNRSVRARVSGYLQSVHFTDGAIVKKGRCSSSSTPTVSGRTESHQGLIRTGHRPA